jgi:hypothetical protein
LKLNQASEDNLNFHPIERDAFLLPPDMSQWLSPGHLAHFVIEVVETLDLSAFMAKFRSDGVGATAYHPKVLVGVLLYVTADRAALPGRGLYRATTRK